MHLKFCYVYTNNASIPQEMRFLYINEFILESCHICMESLTICLHRNVNNSKFIKKNSPLKFDQYLPLSCVDIERLFKMSARQRSQTTRQVCRRLEEETNVTKIYLIH